MVARGGKRIERAQSPQEDWLLVRGDSGTGTEVRASGGAADRQRPSRGTVRHPLH